jgi:hypothetical protein
LEEEEEDALESLNELSVASWIREANVELGSCFRIELPIQVGPPKRSAQTVTWKSGGTEIPKGALFYPSCGRDLSHAVANFGEAADSLHFADVHVSPSGSPVGNLPSTTVSVPHVGTVVSMEPEERELNVDGSVVHFHASDGLVALVRRVPDLSIFYYRGDSPGEGGSNQRWLEPVLFHYVLERLMDGGLIVTDGSNCGYYDDVMDIVAPWNRMCPGPDKPDLTDSEAPYFKYAHREFQLICELEHPRGAVAAWQVRAATT